MLLIDYVMSLQYFRTFRAAAENLRNQGRCLDLVREADGITDITLLRAIEAYLDGLIIVLSKSWIGGVTLWTIAKSILRAELQPWIRKNHDDLLQTLESLPDWQSVKQVAAVDPAQLNVLFLKKLEGEGKRHTAGRSIHSEDDAVFNETDRIVKRLLRLPKPPDPDGKTHSLGKSLVHLSHWPFPMLLHLWKPILLKHPKRIWEVPVTDFASQHR